MAAHRMATAKKAAKREGTVRQAACCRKMTTCPVHGPHIALEVRQHGKWVRLGTISPDHKWV